MDNTFNFDEEVFRLVTLADEKGVIYNSFLDDMVHDTASAMASNANNEGTEAQIKFILTHSGPAAIAEIEKAINEEAE